MAFDPITGKWVNDYAAEMDKVARLGYRGLPDYSSSLLNFNTNRLTDEQRAANREGMLTPSQAWDWLRQQWKRTNDVGDLQKRRAAEQVGGAIKNVGSNIAAGVGSADSRTPPSTLSINQPTTYQGDFPDGKQFVEGEGEDAHYSLPGAGIVGMGQRALGIGGDMVSGFAKGVGNEWNRFWDANQAHMNRPPQPDPGFQQLQNELQGMTDEEKRLALGYDTYPDPYGRVTPSIVHQMQQLDKVIEENTEVANDETVDLETRKQATENVNQAQQVQQQLQQQVQQPSVDLTPINPAMLEQGNQPDQYDGLRGAINKFREIGGQVTDNPGLWDAVIDFSQRLGQASQGSPYGLNSADILSMGVQALDSNMFGRGLTPDDIAAIQQIMEAGYTKEQATDIYLNQKREDELQRAKWQREDDKLAAARKLAADKLALSKQGVVDVLRNNYGINYRPDQLGEIARDPKNVEKKLELFASAEQQVHGYTKLKGIIERIPAGTFGSFNQMLNSIGKIIKSRSQANVELTQAELEVRDKILQSFTGPQTDEDANRVLESISTLDLTKEGSLNVINNKIARYQDDVNKYAKEYYLAQGNGDVSFYVKDRYKGDFNTPPPKPTTKTPEEIWDESSRG